MKQIFFFFGIMAACLLAVNIFSPPGSVSGADRPAANFSALDQRPIFGWRVCEDLGTGVVPGVGITRQRFRLCQGDGWQVLAYCLNTTIPAPPVGTMCSFVNATDIWCGDSVQLLREYSLLATAPPTPVPSSTFTPTFTNTPTRTFTPTFTRTNTPTATATATITPPQPLASQQPSPTPWGGGGGGGQRPRPGGPGNSGGILLAGALAALALAAGGAWWQINRKIQETLDREKELD